MKICNRITLGFVAVFGLIAALLYSSVEGQVADNIFLVKMYGAEVGSGVPADPDGFGTAELDFNYVTNSVVFKIYLSKITEPIGIQVAQGSRGTVGTAACSTVNLFSKQVIIKSPRYGYYTVEGAAPIRQAVLESITSSPSDHYILVTTSQFPSGAIRGQLEVSQRGIAFSISDFNTQNSP